MYQWGHIDSETYRARYEELESQLASLRPGAVDETTIARLAHFLRNVADGWAVGNQEQRNALARTLFEAVWIRNQQVSAVTPRPEMKPFFDLKYKEMSGHVLQWRPRPDSNRRSPH